MDEYSLARESIRMTYLVKHLSGRSSPERCKQTIAFKHFRIQSFDHYSKRLIYLHHKKPKHNYSRSIKYGVFKHLTMVMHYIINLSPIIVLVFIFKLASI